MKFKEFRDLIFSPCYVEFDNMRCFVETHEPTEFDDYEVEGVRANTFDDFDECVVVNLCERAVDTDNVDFLSELNRVYSQVTGKNIQAEGVK